VGADVEREREALGALGEGAEDPGDDPVGSGIERIASALEDATVALERARGAPNATDRTTELARVREAAQRAAGGARRVEALVARGRQGSLEGRVTTATELLERLDALLDAVTMVRDGVEERSAALERRTLDERNAEDVPAQLRDCSQQEAELQAKLHSAGNSVTDAEVRAAQLRDRRDEAASGLERISSQLGREMEAATEPLAAEEREEIERKLERLARRREALGPVNPLAEQEYSEALEHVGRLEEQRHDLDAALAELEGLIADTDHKIRSAFEDTFEATQRNFEELIEHLFPGGRGRLRLVGEATPRLVLGGGPEIADAERDETDPAAADAGAEEEGPSRGRGQGVLAGAEHAAGNDGVEIEVTPAGKATRRLSLLSGGEKALVALAFVFAVFLARPSPFYILDEVEAALDDANIDRFLQLVRRFSSRAQFVIVTHQKRTMDAADVLYGVSIGKGGITKVVSRRLSHEEEEQEDGAAAAEAA
jgi:chromosome segregation protein